MCVGFPSYSASQGLCQRQEAFDKGKWLKKLAGRRQCTERTLEEGRVAVPSRRGLETASLNSICLEVTEVEQM